MKRTLLFSLLLGGIGLSYAAVHSAENLKLTTENEFTNESVEAVYHPVKLTSSCGYTEYVEFNPASDHLDCLLVELQAMEDWCSAPWEDWGYA